MCNKFDKWGVARVLVAVLCLCAPALVLAQSTSSDPQANAASQTASSFKPAFAGKYFHVPSIGTSASRTSNIIGISVEPGGMRGTQSFSLTLPANADGSTLKVTLNGRDVSDRFRGSSGFVTASDGFSTVKNVLSATVKTSSGSMASGRWRSMSAPVSKTNSLSKVAPLAMVRANGALPTPMANATPVEVDPVCDPVAMCPAWLPPSVRFDTIAKGNWNGTTPWVLVNGVSSNGITGATAYYVIAVYNRQTLVLENFQWFPSAGGAQVTSFIAKYTSNDLVVLGTGAASSGVDTGLDTSAIGGTNFGNCNCTLPQSYMIIGSGGQTPGTAYENMRSANAFATGSLLEDANGNYNFQSSDIVEYAIEPQDPNNSGNPAIEMNVPANLSVAGESRLELEAPVLTGQNGLWLLVLDRTTLVPPYNNTSAICSDLDAPGAPTRVVVNCGTFYAVGAGNSNIDGAWQALANALAAVTPNQLVFLQSIGSVGTSSLAQTVESGSSLTGFQQFYNHFQPVGGTPKAVAGPNFTNQDNYGFVGYLGAGNALTGGAAELSTAFPKQMGVLHGTLQHDANGLYRPAQTSPEQQGLFNAKGGLNDSDFTLGIASYQQPGDWPSNSATVLLPGASTIAGQQAAYRFISHWLLAGYYMKTIQGPHQDDIHFFFSGSTNTSINYQTMDPANLPSPNIGTWNTNGCTAFDGTTCTFQATGDSAPSTFTVSDFNAVKTQLSLEVVYLTNTLQYLVTGSTNLKDVVASGNANVGLALSAAANTIEGSGMANLSSQEIANKQVSFSWQSLLGFLGGVAQSAADIEGLGEAATLFKDLTEAAQTNLKLAASGANAIGALVATVGSGGGISTSHTTLSSSPQPFAQLTTTVGQLATQDLQSPLLIGFDTTADNITSDWGRLSTIGPRTTNTNDTVFFAPNQVTQVTAINALTNASASTFYFSLLPTVYNVHIWYGVSWVGQAAGVFQPTVGSLESHLEQDSCNPFYVSFMSNGNLGTLSPYQGITYPSVGGGPVPFAEDEGAVDFWVIDGVVSKAGSNSTNIAVMDADLATNLFAPDQLNIPMLQFLSGNGPMISVVKDASVDRISGWSNDNICDASDSSSYGSSGVLTAPPPGGKTLTTTSLVSPMSGVLGHDMVVTAKVMAGSQPITSGLVYLSVDGTVVGNPSMAADGTASLTVPGGIALGKHQIQADYAPGAGSTFAGSSAQPATYVVYSESADISIAIASTNINVSYSTPSTPVAVQIGSVAGLAGNVALSCTGLPAGLACTFGSTSMTLSAGGNVNTTVQIVPTTTARNATKITSANKTTLAFLMLPLLGVGCLRRGRFLVSRLLLLLIATGVTAMTLSGCSGGSSTPTLTRPTGTQTITVNASVGSVSRSMGVNINIQ